MRPMCALPGKWNATSTRPCSQILLVLRCTIKPIIKSAVQCANTIRQPCLVCTRKAHQMSPLFPHIAPSYATHMGSYNFIDSLPPEASHMLFNYYPFLPYACFSHDSIICKRKSGTRSRGKSEKQCRTSLWTTTDFRHRQESWVLHICQSSTHMAVLSTGAVIWWGSIKGPIRCHKL